MSDIKKPFSLLIKPAGADCNIRCDYCFYLEKLQMQKKRPRMTDQVLERLIKGYMKSEQPVYSFNFQGGEPTLMGLDYFRKVVELEKKYAPWGATISNTIQTNGMLINDEFAEFLAANKFLVGLSLDGPDYIHNKYRKDCGGKGTHAKVLNAAGILDRHGVEYNILSLVNSFSVTHATEIYEYLKDKGFYYHQYTPCVEFEEEWCLEGEDWGDFLIELFDAWYPNDVYRISIRYFDSLINKMVTGQASICHMDCSCCQYYVVEHEGSVFPCDFFVRPELKLGNIRTSTWLSFQESKKYADFGARKMALPEECRKCKWFQLCMGDCQKHRRNLSGDRNSLSHLCKGYKKFYAHAAPAFEKIAADTTRRMRSAQAVQRERKLPPLSK